MFDVVDDVSEETQNVTLCRALPPNRNAAQEWFRDRAILAHRKIIAGKLYRVTYFELNTFSDVQLAERTFTSAGADCLVVERLDDDTWSIEARFPLGACSKCGDPRHNALGCAA